MVTVSITSFTLSTVAIFSQNNKKNWTVLKCVCVQEGIEMCCMSVSLFKATGGNTDLIGRWLHQSEFHDPPQDVTHGQLILSQYCGSKP